MCNASGGQQSKIRVFKKNRKARLCWSVFLPGTSGLGTPGHNDCKISWHTRNLEFQIIIRSRIAKSEGFN